MGFLLLLSIRHRRGCIQTYLQTVHWIIFAEQAEIRVSILVGLLSAAKAWLLSSISGVIVEMLGVASRVCIGEGHEKCQRGVKSADVPWKRTYLMQVRNGVQAWRKRRLPRSV